jgi:hypothetical protein
VAWVEGSIGARKHIFLKKVGLRTDGSFGSTRGLMIIISSS